MRIATWNVNSLRVRLPHVLKWISINPVDVLCLQELKINDIEFPINIFNEKGYQSFFAAQRTFNGVAVLVRKGLFVDEKSITRNITGFQDIQQRLISVTVENLRVVCVYFPNGYALGTEKFSYKLRWFEAFYSWLIQEMTAYPRLALLGDFNIAPEDRDVYDPRIWAGRNLVSNEERELFRRLLSLGLKDAFRLFENNRKCFSWWDYRMFSFQRNAGMRIDHILLSQPLADACTSSYIDKQPRYDKRPSDHTPVIAQINL